LLRDVPGLEDAVAGRGPLTRSWPWSLGLNRPLDLRGLAELLAGPDAIQVTLASLDAPALALAEVAAWHGGAVTREQALAEAGQGRAAVLDRAAEVLHARLLTDPDADAGWLALRDDVAAQVQLPGIPAEPALRHATSEALAGQLRLLGVSPPARKGERIEALVAALRDPAVVERVMDALPGDAAQIFAELLTRGPQEVSDLGVPYWPQYGRSGSRRGAGLVALLQRGLVGVDVHEQVCFIWLDVLVGLRGGRLYGDAFPSSAGEVGEPAGGAGGAGRSRAGEVGGAAGVAARPLAGGPVGIPVVVERLDALLAHWRSRPVPALAAGGLGVRGVRDAAKALGLPAGEVGLLAHLAAELGLLGLVEVGASGRGRNRTVERRWAPTPLAQEYSEQPAARRWALLVQAWRDDHRLDEAGGLPERRDAGLGGPADATSVIARAGWLRLLDGLPPGTGVDQDALTRLAAARLPALLHRERVAGLLGASRVLGLVAPSGPVGLTEAGRALLESPEALADRLPAPATEVVVQADSTVIVPPGAAPELTGALSRWGELESDAGARVYRLSERRLAAALDSGETGEEVLAWLEEHSKVDVPQNVAYLVRDVARRSGRLRAGAAGTYLRCDDPALLSSAVAVSAAKLRLLAPTVAVSPLTRERLLAALATKGVSAVAEDATGATVSGAPATAEPVAFHVGSALPAVRPGPDPQGVAARLLGDPQAQAPLDGEDVLERLKRRSRAHASTSSWHQLGDALFGAAPDEEEW